MVTSSGSMVEEDQMAGLPSRDAAKEFYMKYDVKERLGRGLSSVVHLCIDKMTGKEYAAKIMDISQDHVNADGMNIVEQIHEEIRLLKLVEGHKYIIRLEDVFESPAFLFLVFELCQNYDLFEYLSANVSLSEKRCRAIMKEVFEAVHHCHQVSPQEVFVWNDFTTFLHCRGECSIVTLNQKTYSSTRTTTSSSQILAWQRKSKAMRGSTSALAHLATLHRKFLKQGCVRGVSATGTASKSTPGPVVLSCLLFSLVRIQSKPL